ncbi:U11/U12 small nuclear ribonucleoprotein 48 kDa protein [Xylocopa sonorina]|uniref:U11/U12 small nuclear ribonucleoprotein 48 kDa protein n=1 Tax=Xylocopa sonorina TaxID=1818115 RepID=UPI00403AAF97
MSDCLTNQRENEYQKLKNFTNEIDQDIMRITSSLGWTMERTENDSDNRLICPYDSSHQIGKKMLDQHLESCQWKQEGYSELDTPLPESSLPLNSYSSIKLDLPLQNSILQEAKKKDPTLNIGLAERLIPRTSNRIFADFTCDERKVLYQYVISNTVKPDIGHDIEDIQKLKSDDKEDKKLSFLELLIQERNLKRRRAKHKGVHTNKKSHTEILREIIHQQMELYTEYITEPHATSSNAATVRETQSSDRKHENLSDHHRSFSHNKKYEQLDKPYSSKTDPGHQEKYSRHMTESGKKRKHRKHKRSRSRDRDHKKSKYESTRTHKKDKLKYCENEKLFDSNTYIKQRNDRRENEEKLPL